MDWKFYPANTAPLALDIVWCRFPLVEDPTTPGPKARPGLVKCVIVKDQKAYIEVVYGTSHMGNYSHADLIIANTTDLIEMGLPQATLFQLPRSVVIPWSEEWIGPLDGHGPVIGRLNAKYREYLVRLQQRGGGRR